FVADFVGETNLVEGEIVESTPGQVTITALGSTKTVAGEWGEKGDKVTLSIRPESLFVRPAASTSRLSGTIRNAVFLGSYTQLELICGDGTDLLVHVGPLQDAIDFTPGTALAIDWDEAQVAVLR